MALPVGQGPPTPARVARALLDRVVAYYAEHADDEHDPPAPLPAAQFVAGGEPRVVAWDRDEGQVTVAYERTILGMRPSQPAPTARPRQQNRGALVRSVALEVQIVRPAPSLDYLGRVPGLTALDAHGYALGVDLYHLYRAAAEAVEGDHLTRANVKDAEVVLGDCLSLGPSGKVAAVALGITVPLL